MRILFVTETYPPEINGVARTLREMCEGLAGMGHQVHLIRPQQRRESCDQDSRLCEQILTRGVAIPAYPGLQFGLPANRQIKQLLDETPPDVAYIATEGPLGNAALKQCQRRGIPVVSGMHTNFHQYSKHYRAQFLSPFIMGYLRRFHNRCEKTLVPTQEQADILGNMGFQRLDVWPRGVHTKLFSNQHRNEALRAAWGLQPDQLAILYVGRIAPEKNIDLAFDAFAAIQQENPEARFVLVGDGPCRKRLAQQHPDAIFCGQKTGLDLAQHYASGDMFLFPSMTETFGNVVLEAMASGLPIVSYRMAAAAELMTHTCSGLLAEPADDGHFIQLACQLGRDQGLRVTLKRHALAIALQHDWPTLLNRLESVFLRVGDKPDAEAVAATQ